MNPAKRYFRKFAVLIEEYAVELFILEALAIILIYHSIRNIEIITLTVFVAFFLSETIKFFVDENRPKTAQERAYFKKHRSRLKNHSFPSTHSSVVAAFAGAFYGTYIFIPLLAFALLVMYSRVYLKSHYPRDVFAGGALGILIGYSITILL
ncbi:MAG: phosphatase PAP2 family protein [Candidatus Parvarchaeota archaeon]|nr:phosphatase PAP2 family protein [Candidatus Parvarchaeota archaeon]